MRILKEGAFIILTIGLFLSLLLTNVFFSISWSVSYDEVHGELLQANSEILEDDYDLSNLIEKTKEEIKDHCLPHSEYEFELRGIKNNLSCEKIIAGEEITVEELSPLYNNRTKEITKKVTKEYEGMLNYCIENENFYLKEMKRNLSCERANNENEEIVNSIVEDYTKETYYEEYEKCNFWDCLKETESTYFLISQKAKDYWRTKANIFILISLVIAIILFILIENKYNFPLLIGTIIILSGAPLLKIDSFVATLTKPFLKGLEFIDYQNTGAIKSIISVFFSKAIDLFYVLLLLGIIILIIGTILRFWSFFTGRDKKLFSKKEISKLIQKELKGKKK